jgi:hypothetical protein
MYKVLLQWKHATASVCISQSQSPIKEALCPPSKSLLYPAVNKEVGRTTVLGEGQFLRRGVTFVTRETCVSYFSECKQFRKNSYVASCLGFS